MREVASRNGAGRGRDVCSRKNMFCLSQRYHSSLEQFEVTLMKYFSKRAGFRSMKTEETIRRGPTAGKLQSARLSVVRAAKCYRESPAHLAQAHLYGFPTHTNNNSNAFILGRLLCRFHSTVPREALENGRVVGRNAKPCFHRSMSLVKGITCADAV